MVSAKTIWIVAFACTAYLSALCSAQDLYIPDKLFTANYTDYGDIYPTTIQQTFVQNGTPTTITNQFFDNVTPFPTSYTHEESGITGCCAPVDDPSGTGVFERNEHVARFATASENNQGHLYQRHEAWDIAFDLKIDTPNVAPRKEAGLYFKSPSVGNALFNVTSNDGFYTTGPGTIGVVFQGVIPDFTFSGGGGPLGDYNQNGTVDAADYVIWRQTLGSTTDFRANGNNEGASMDVIDQADYDVWRGAFGETGNTGPNYHVGDTVHIRLIYTPPVLNDPNMPDVNNDPNVVTAGTMEYRVSINGGPEQSSGPKTFTNSWQGIPNDTQIMLRIQNLGTASVVDDSSTVTFSNFDFNGDLPGSGLGAGTLLGASVPEPGSLLLAGLCCLFLVGLRRHPTA